DEEQPVAGSREPIGERPALLEDRAHPVGDHGSAIVPVPLGNPRRRSGPVGVPSGPWSRSGRPAPTTPPGARPPTWPPGGSPTGGWSPTTTSTPSGPRTGWPGGRTGSAATGRA